MSFSKPELIDAPANWPPVSGETVTFQIMGEIKEGVLGEIRWGLVWRDFILEDGRVIPEHKMLGATTSPEWRDPQEVSAAEREYWEERLVDMAEAGLDPRNREQSFWAELNQYLAYTHLRLKRRSQELQNRTSNER